MPMGIAKVNIGIDKFLFSLPIQGIYIKYLITLAVPSLKCMLHLQNINLEVGTHNMHGDHLVKGDIHMCFQVKTHYGGQKMLSQISFFETMELSTST
jgi:hypothetical protein